MTQFGPVAFIGDIPQVPPVSQSIGQGTYLVSGGNISYSQSGLTINVGPGVASVNYTRVEFATASLTPGVADNTNPRFDAIVVSALGVLSLIAGTAASTPTFPDYDPLTQCIINYVRIDANAATLAITTTDIYKENTEWTSSVSGGTVSAASTSNPFAGTKSIQWTAAASGAYARLTNGAAVSLSTAKQLNLQVRPGSSWPNAKSILVTWYNGSTKVGQSVALANRNFGLDTSSQTYQAISIPISNFQIASTDSVTILELKVNGGGATLNANIDNVVLEGTSNLTVPPTPTIDYSKQTIAVAVGDETSAITTGVAKSTFRWKGGFKLTEISASLSTASASGGPVQFDVNVNGSTILSTKLTIDDTEKTSKTAATKAVISAPLLSDDDEVTIDIDTAGSGAKGPKIYFTGNVTS